MSEPDRRVTETNRDGTLPPPDIYPTEVAVVRALVYLNESNGTHDYSIAFTTHPQRNFPYDQAIWQRIPMGQVLSNMCEFVVATQVTRNAILTTSAPNAVSTTSAPWSINDECNEWQIAVQNYCQHSDSVVSGITMTYSPNFVAAGIDIYRVLTSGIPDGGQQTAQGTTLWPISKIERDNCIRIARRYDRLDTQLCLTRASPAEPPRRLPGTLRLPTISTYPKGFVFEIRGTTGQVQANDYTQEHRIEIQFEERTNPNA